MTGLEEAAAEFARANPDEAPAAEPRPTPNVPGSTATPQPEAHAETADQVDADDEGPSATAMPMEEIAELAVSAIDFGIQNFVSKRCAYKADQKAELSRLGAKVLKKWFPDIEGAIEPEYAFIGALGLFAYANYKSSPEPARGPASPPGGSESSNGNSGGLSTEAKVDGKPVAAQVLS